MFVRCLNIADNAAPECRYQSGGREVAKGEMGKGSDLLTPVVYQAPAGIVCTVFHLIFTLAPGTGCFFHFIYEGSEEV